jgi:type III secretion protein V
VTALLARCRQAGDALFALAVLLVVVLLVAPVPPALLDAGLALSLALACAVLAVTLLARDALSFAAFPTLLLLTTLLRLALSVSATRLVLTRGQAGRIIEALGNVAVQGSPVAGAVVFAILTLVQLLVVARGAERVAEVAARFTLDALPGKQLAIDADLRAGLVDAAEAARRRRALERESQLHGAMDGALKFVKGDAVAGVAIVLVNLAGGLVAGALRGRPLGEAAARAVVLAVGDGLASQLPALLTAAAAGVAVTRVAAEEEGGRLAGEVGRQLLGQPAPLWIVTVLLGGLAATPGLPAVPFLALAAGAGALAWRRRGTGAAIGPEAAGPPAAGLPPEPFVADGEGEAPLVLELAGDLLALAREAGERDLVEGLPALRRRLWRDLGVPLPALQVRGAGLADGEWVLLLHDVPAARGRAGPGERLALAPLQDLELAGIAFEPEPHPATGRPAGLVAAADADRAAALGPVLGPLERLTAACSWELERHAALLIGVQEAQALLDVLEPSAPALVREAARALPPALLAEVLRRLLEEGVPIRPLRAVLEAMLEAGGAPRGAAVLAAAARRALGRHIGHRAAAAGPLHALILDPATEGAVRQSMMGELPALEPAHAARLLDALEAALGAAGDAPVLLASGDVRRAVRLLVAARHPRLQVLAYDELPPELPVRPVGRVALAA